MHVTLIKRLEISVDLSCVSEDISSQNGYGSDDDFEKNVLRVFPFME